MPLQAVLLDAAGTLIQTAEPVGETYARVAEAYGARISAWRLGEAFGRAMAAAPPMAFPEASRDEMETLEREWWRDLVRVTFLSADSAVRPNDMAACFETLFAHFAKPEAWQLREGALAALEALRARGLRLAVVSNFDQRLPGLLLGLGIASHFECVVLPGDCGFAKPDREIFDAALTQLGVAAGDAVFAGDDPDQDLAGARGAGLRAIDVGALATLAELPAAIDALASGG